MNNKDNINYNKKMNYKNIKIKQNKLINQNQSIQSINFI